MRGGGGGKQGFGVSPSEEMFFSVIGNTLPRCFVGHLPFHILSCSCLSFVEVHILKRSVDKCVLTDLEVFPMKFKNPCTDLLVFTKDKYRKQAELSHIQPACCAFVQPCDKQFQVTLQMFLSAYDYKKNIPSRFSFC